MKKILRNDVIAIINSKSMSYNCGISSELAESNNDNTCEAIVVCENSNYIIKSTSSTIMKKLNNSHSLKI